MYRQDQTGEIGSVRAAKAKRTTSREGEARLSGTGVLEGRQRARGPSGDAEHSANDVRRDSKWHGALLLAPGRPGGDSVFQCFGLKLKVSWFGFTGATGA